jgi:hypothetical protein
MFQDMFHNGQLQVYKISNIKGVKPNAFYEGFLIHLKVDKRWLSHDMKKEYYNARL